MRCLMVLLWVTIYLPFVAGQEEKLPALNESKSRIVFDPKKVQIGARGAVNTGCGGVVVLIKARNAGICEFEYNTDGCGGVHSDFRCRVPLDSGLVTIEVNNGGITHSFDKAVMKKIRGSGPNGAMEVVEVAGEDVEIRRKSHASEMYANKGDTVRFRFRFYTDAELSKDDQTAAFNQMESFVMGSDAMWPWLAKVAEGMSVGDCWEVVVPTKIAAGAMKWQTKAGPMLYIQLRMVGLERAGSVRP